MLSLGWQRGRAAAGGLERELIDDLARRIALWIDNAQLYEERAAVASTLQTALLPPELPERAAASRSPPATCRPTRPARSAATSSTSSGPAPAGRSRRRRLRQGREAAAATALARYTLRAAFGRGRRRPGRRLALLDARCWHEGDGERFLTAVLGRAERAPDGGSDAAGLGGHPAPIVLRAGGEREPLEPEGRVLGIPIDGGWDVAETVLAARRRGPALHRRRDRGRPRASRCCRPSWPACFRRCARPRRRGGSPTSPSASRASAAAAPARRRRDHRAEGRALTANTSPDAGESHRQVSG